VNVSIFGYGSLLNKKSFEKTLGTEIAEDKFQVTYLHDYVRSWTLYHNLSSYPVERKRLFPKNKKYIVYLDISEDKGNKILGSLVPVTPRQLENFDMRELNYFRRNVSNKLEFNHIGTEGHVYIGCPNFKTELIPVEECVIVKEYIEIVEKGLDELSGECKKEFWESTLPTDIDIISVPGFYPN